MYWLGLDENVIDAHGPTYPSHAAVDNGLASAVHLGATMVRSETLGVSVGSPRSLEPTLGHFNARAFDSIDYAVARARHDDLRLMIPLTDEWRYYEGGKSTFTSWAGIRSLPGQTAATSSVERRREALFYTDPTVIGYFHAYIRHLLDHLNPLTGLRLGDDPTIAVWETGNELWDAPPSWTEQTAAYIKRLDPHALVADGSAASGKNIDQTGYREPDVDIVDGHFYPVDTAKALSDSRVTTQAGKVYMVGEYPLTGSDTGTFLSALADHRRIAGGLAWSLFPWLPDGRPEQHDDGYTFHFPAANASEGKEDGLQIAYAKAVRSMGG